MKIVKHRKLKALENSWNELFKENENSVPNMEFEFMRLFNENLNAKLSNAIKKTNPCYYEIIDNNQTQMIIPLITVENKLQSQYTLDYFDLLMRKDLTGNKIIEYLTAISQLENKQIELLRFKENCATFEKLKDVITLNKYNECVKIDFPSSYDEYYNSLSKHARQNLRTAYNRLKTDNKQFEFRTFYGPLSKNLAKNLEKVYLKRRVGRYKNMNFLKKILYSMSDPIADVCFNLNNSFTTVLYIDNKIVAFMSGHIQNKEIIIPRLAIDETFSRYSVGIILVNETIKEIQQKGFSCLDLATGTENYKYQMGGVSHFNYSLTIGGENEQI